MSEASVTPTPSLWSTIGSWFTPPVLFLLLNLMIGTIALTSHLSSSHTSHDDHHRQHKNRDHAKAQEFADETPQETRNPTSSPSMFWRLMRFFNFYRRSTSSHEQPTGSPPSPSSMQTPEVETQNFERFQEHEHEQEQEQEQERRSFAGSSPTPPQKPKPSGLYSHIIIEPTSPHTPTTRGYYTDQEPGTSGTYHQSFEQEEAKERRDELPRRSVRRSASVSLYPVVRVDEDEKEEEEDGHLIGRRRRASAKEGKGRIADQMDEEVDARADDFINRFKHQLKMQRQNSMSRQRRDHHRSA